MAPLCPRTSRISTLPYLQALARGEKVEQLVEKSEGLNDSAGQFQRGSTALRRKMQCRYYKVMAMLALVVLAIIAYITVPLIGKE